MNGPIDTHCPPHARLSWLAVNDVTVERARRRTEQITALSQSHSSAPFDALPPNRWKLQQKRGTQRLSSY